LRQLSKKLFPSRPWSVDWADEYSPQAEEPLVSKKGSNLRKEGSCEAMKSKDKRKGKG
jgi:hypothetical protein